MYMKIKKIKMLRQNNWNNLYNSICIFITPQFFVYDIQDINNWNNITLLLQNKISMKKYISLYQGSSIWEGINGTTPLYILLISQFLIKIKLKLNLKNKIKLLNIKSVLNFIYSIFQFNKKKKIFLILLIIYKLLSLLNTKIFINYYSYFPCGSYLIDRLPLNFNSLFYLLEADNYFILYFIFFFIILITLIIINLMIIFIIMVLSYNNNLYKLYKIISVINEISTLYSLNKFIKFYKFCFVLTINIFRLLNTGLSSEDVLLLYTKFFDYNILNSNKIRHSFMDEDTQNNIITNIDNSQASSSSLNSNTSSPKTYSF